MVLGSLDADLAALGNQVNCNFDIGRQNARRDFQKFEKERRAGATLSAVRGNFRQI